ncbi:MAG: DUF2182 domain-containing protein [Chloroflexota bacterium]
MRVLERARLDEPRGVSMIHLPLARASTVAWAAIVGAWLILLTAEVTGYARLLHHDALIEEGPPLWIGVLLFLLSWQVLIAAMMLPASLPTIRLVGVAMARLTRPRLAEAAFLGAFALVWTIFGLLAFTGDFVLHHVVDATPWLAARPWLIEAGVLGLAGAYQFAPSKVRSLAACRHPGGLLTAAATPQRDSFQIGMEHGLACLGSGWALMLLMFAEGFGDLAWMGALTVLMAYEVTGRQGERARRVAGFALLIVGLAVLSGPMASGA